MAWKFEGESSILRTCRAFLNRRYACHTLVYPDVALVAGCFIKR
jgi:hypothetical protein